MEPYYLQNFRTVLEDVEARHADLLLPREAERLASFGALGPGARMLYVRLLTRRGPWVRRDSLAYPEIGDPGPALEELKAAGFAATEEAALPAELAPLLRRPEIEARLRAQEIPFPRKTGRNDLEALLLERAPGAVPIPAASALERDWADLMLLLFFGNGNHGLADFVVADLGHVRYEAYPLDPADRAFRTREELDALRGLDALRESLEAGGDLEAATEALLAMESCPGIRGERRWRRLLAEAGRAWERLGEPERALACLRRGGVPPCRERIARIHLAQDRIPEAAETALAMAEGPLDTAEAAAARRILARLARREPRAAAWLKAHPPDPPPPSLRLTVPRHPSGLPELAALEAAEGWRGWHCENVLWNALYGLAFWDVLFAPVRGAFHHPFQAAPADLRSPDFARAREAAIAERLARLGEPGEAPRLILETLEGKRGVANAFVNWKALPEGLVEAALETVPRGALGAVLGAMARNPAAWRSGFPDLFLCREGRCMLWEVKGPGDALRPEQERWLGIFNRAGLEARVVWIRYGEDA